MGRNYDVIVIGLGGMGSTTAYQLAKRGQRVLGIEQFSPAHDQGSSHGESRIYRQAYFEDPAYVPLLLRAYELWEEIKHESGQELLTVTGGLMMGPPDSETVQGSLKSAKQWNLPFDMLDASEIHKRFPVFTPSRNQVALYEKHAGFIRPELSVYTHLVEAEKNGAELRFNEKVLHWEARSTGEGVTVITENGRFEAGKLIITAGPWSSQLLKNAGLENNLEVERQIMMFFEPIGGIEPFRVGNFPIYVWDSDDYTQLYGFPSSGLRGEGAKVAFFRKGGIRCTPETIDRNVYEEEVNRLRHYLDQGLPALNGRLLQAKTCMYTNTPDQHFVISQHPNFKQVNIATGFSGHGFKFASVIGEILADLTINGTTNQPIELFRPQRFVEVPGTFKKK